VRGDDVYAVLRSRIARVLRVEEDQIAPGTSLVDDLDADSLDLVELMLDLKDEFGIDVDDGTTRDLLRSGGASGAGGADGDGDLGAVLSRLTVGDMSNLLCIRLGVAGA
jgi:acyl carrier protein